MIQQNANPYAQGAKVAGGFTIALSVIPVFVFSVFAILFLVSAAALRTYDPTEDIETFIDDAVAGIDVGGMMEGLGLEGIDDIAALLSNLGGIGDLLGMLGNLEGIIGELDLENMNPDDIEQFFNDYMGASYVIGDVDAVLVEAEADADAEENHGGSISDSISDTINDAADTISDAATEFAVAMVEFLATLFEVFGVIMLVFSLGALIPFITGILCVALAKKPEKYTVAKVFAVISAIIAFFSFNLFAFIAALFCSNQVSKAKAYALEVAAVANANAQYVNVPVMPMAVPVAVATPRPVAVSEKPIEVPAVEQSAPAPAPEAPSENQ
ncbi:MAG: hypothetical protein J6Y65_01235 [Eggerthellaceae bacterium]|nr:hypothetical protein [Eggerthellaceae bacterium]